MVIAKEMHKIFSTCFEKFFFVFWGNYFFSSARVELEVEGANFSQRLETALTLRNHIIKQIQTAVKGGTAAEIASTVSAIWPEEVLKQQFNIVRFYVTIEWVVDIFEELGEGVDKLGWRQVKDGGGDGVNDLNLI